MVRQACGGGNSKSSEGSAARWETQAGPRELKMDPLLHCCRDAPGI